MKINIDKKKSVETVSGILQKTTNISKKAVTGIQNNVKDIADKTKSDNYLRRLKKYNPLFLDRYQSKEFNIPNMIVIVDDAVRRGIDVCEGAIGWIKQENGMEILCLYDEAIDISGIQFVPDAQCDAIYYVDRFDRKRFVKLECLFSRAQEEKIAELEHIAYSLGAKCCSVEISESSREVKEEKRKFDLSGSVKARISASSKESTDQSLSCKSSSQSVAKGMVRFQGNSIPKKPELKWFQNDDNIKRLIEMRCEGQNIIESKVLELEGASAAVMSMKTAYAIDNAVNRLAEVKGTSSMESQALREHHSKFVFCIEF